MQDLVALQLADRSPLLFRTEALGVEGRSAGDRWCPLSTTATRKGRPASRWSAAAVRRGFRDISRHVFHASTAHADPPGTRARVPVLLAGCPGRSPAALRGVDPHTRRGRLRPATYARPGRTRRALGDRRRPQPGTRTGHRQVRAPRAVTSTSRRATGALLLAGDAARIVPPAGAEGLHDAVSDVRVPARAFIDPHESGTAQLLDRYSELCLDRVRRPARFSYDTTRMPRIRPESAPSTTVSGPPGCAGSLRPGRRPPNRPPLHGTAVGSANRPAH